MYGHPSAGAAVTGGPLQYDQQYQQHRHPQQQGQQHQHRFEQLPQPPYHQHQHQRHASSPRVIGMLSGAVGSTAAPSTSTAQFQQQGRQQQQQQPPPYPQLMEKENSPLRTASPTKRGKLVPQPPSQQQSQPYQQQGQAGPSSSTADRSRNQSSPSKNGPLSLLAAVGRGTTRQRPAEPIRNLDEEFDKLLHTLEVPDSLKVKLRSMSHSVKESMIRGQTLVAPPRARSGSMPSSALFSQHSQHPSQQSQQPSQQDAFSTASPLPPRSTSANTIALQANGARGAREIPEYFATHLKANDAARIDLARIRRLRVLLGSESPRWSSDFIGHGGLAALCTRMQELVDMEWREEQHDDQLLYEILRCLLVLVRTDRGGSVMGAQLPSPFPSLVELVFSEKKPGDLGTRKIIFEMVGHLLCVEWELSEVCLRGVGEVQSTRHLGKSASKVAGAAAARQDRMRFHPEMLQPGSPVKGGGRAAQAQKRDSILALVLALLSNPRTPSSEAMLDFISASHTPRPFKTYLAEVSGVCRDYFWIFCHSQNRYWDLGGVNVADVESPKVPGGATGSVEFEAMGYLTCHLRLLNMVGSSLVERHAYGGLADGHSAAYEFYSELFASGMERILAVLRKSSQVYYQPTHLELARFFHLSARAGFGIPPGLQVWQAQPLAI
ncbi:hypothetical protein V8E36_004072 [Tilletia maclaganii]